MFKDGVSLEDLMKDICIRSEGIPFENSDFQDDNFIINASYTKGRAYRSILLKLSSKVKALMEAQFGLEKEEIDLEELEYNIKTEETKEIPNTFNIRRWKLEIKQKLSNRDFTKKLIDDAIHEVNHLYGRLQEFPKYDRLTFEEEEKEHFKIRLIKQAIGIQGALESLDNMGIKNLQTNSQLVEQIKGIPLILDK